MSNVIFRFFFYFST
ncbi:pheST operon leader peptide PheM [Providencia alcalifaciens]